MNDQMTKATPHQAEHPWTCLALGQAALNQALVTPLGLSINAAGEWQMFQFIALPGHPSPGNAGRGFSHPNDIKVFWLSCGRLGRLPGPLERPPATQSDAVEYAKHLCAWLWPGYSVRIEIIRVLDGNTVGITTYDEQGTVIKYDDEGADAHPLKDITLLRRLNRVELATIASHGNPLSLQRAHQGGSCWEDYPCAEAPAALPPQRAHDQALETDQ